MALLMTAGTLVRADDAGGVRRATMVAGASTSRAAAHQIVMRHLFLALTLDASPPAQTIVAESKPRRPADSAEIADGRRCR
jgi:hypothetical protein